MVDLIEAANGETDKEWHGYLPHYERHLDPIAIRVLTEIGVETGGSLRMWERWLPKAKIIGIEIDPEAPKGPFSDRTTIHYEDVNTIGPTWISDVVIDDGSHHGDDQLAAYAKFWPTVRRGGWYVLEDLNTVWDDDYRDGYLTEMLMAGMMRQSLQHEGTAGNDGVGELHAYEEILFVRKAWR